MTWRIYSWADELYWRFVWTVGMAASTSGNRGGGGGEVVHPGFKTPGDFSHSIRISGVFDCSFFSTKDL